MSAYQRQIHELFPVPAIEGFTKTADGSRCAHEPAASWIEALLFACSFQNRLRWTLVQWKIAAEMEHLNRCPWGYWNLHSLKIDDDLHLRHLSNPQMTASNKSILSLDSCPSAKLGPIEIMHRIPNGILVEY